MTVEVRFIHLQQYAHVASDINKVTTIIEYAELNGREKVKANKLRHTVECLRV